LEGERNKNTGNWAWFKYVVISQKYGKYWVRYTDGIYEYNCSFFKHRKICSHKLGVAQLTDICPNRESIFPLKD
jgi:hypothetical protein